MANDNKISAKSGIDTTDFKTGIASMNRELRVLESGFRASAASLGDWSKDATGLESRIKTLNSAMEIQEKKVAATRAEYERIKAEKGATSRAAQDLEIKLNKETETLGKMGVELQTTEASLQEMQSGTDEASNAVDELGNASAETGGQMETFKSVLGGVGAVVKGTVAAVLGLVAAVAAVTAAVGGLVFSTASASAELVDLSAKTGISTTSLQEMAYIGDQVGVSLDTITGAQAKLVRSMNEGRDGIGDQAEAFKALGISVTDADGNLRNTQDVFAETIDALGKIANPAERDAAAMALFGKSAQELNPLIKTGSAEMAALAEEAHNVGAVMSEEDVAAFEAFDDTLASLQAGLKGTLGTLAAAFLPGFQAVFDQLGGYLKTFTDIVNGSDGDLGKIAEGLTGLVTQIATDVAAQAPQMLEAGLAIVKSILDAITAALPTILTAAIDILKTLITFIVQNLPTLIDAGIQIILTLVDALIANLPMLIDAAIQAILTLVDGLTAALPTLIPAIVEAVTTIVNALVENAPLLIGAALQLIVALAEGIANSFPMLRELTGPQMLGNIANAILQSIPMILTAGAEIIVALARGLVNLIPAETKKVGSAFLENMLVQAALWTVQAVNIGRNFVAGLIDGILGASGALFETVTVMVGDMVDSVTGALDINSPSGIGKGIGKNFIGSMGLGGMEIIRDVERSFASMTGRMSQAAATGLATTSSSSVSSTSNSFDIFGNVIMQGATTPDSFGQALIAKRY